MHRFSQRIRLTLALGAALTACTMPLRPPPIERTEVFSAPYDEVWDATKTWFTSKGLPATFDRTSGLIHAGSRMHPGSAHDWARCGGRPDPTVMGHTLSMEVSVKAIGEAQTSVNGGYGASLGGGTAFAHNFFSGNVAGSVTGGHASAGNSCDDGRCSARGTRRYYLSTNAATGADADIACAAGFHMASLWEIRDPTAIEYDRVRDPISGFDGGSGPSTGIRGWIRTGNSVGYSSGGPGVANCLGWSSSAAGHSGTLSQLPEGWSAAPPTPGASPWEADALPCVNTLRVWCVED